MNWGKSLVLAFILFAVFIGVLVTVCVRQDISLVSPDYYKDELAYQEQIDRLNNTAGLHRIPLARFDGNALEIRYKDFSIVDRGVVTLFRPSDLRFDKHFDFAGTTDSVRRFDIGMIPSGMYKARMTWLMNGKEYYVEHIINL